MTPDEARRLLDLAAGAVFVIHLDSDEAGPLLVEAGGAPLTVPELTLAVHAPDMAAMIAGMHTEYRAEYQSSFGRWYPAPHCCANGSGWGTKQQAERAADYWKADGFATRIVPRYVTEPEEA